MCLSLLMFYKAMHVTPAVPWSISLWIFKPSTPHHHYWFKLMLIIYQIYSHTHTQICCRWPTTTLMMPWIVLSCGHTSLIWWVVFSNEKDDLTTNTVRTVPVQNFDCTLEFCHAKTTHWLLGSCPTSKTLQSLIWKIDCNQIDDNKSETLLNILFLCEYVNNAYVH